jgi:general secretion pathway protein D
LIVKSGETAVLGGLLNKITVDTVRGIPGLMAIPVLKWLFSVKEKQETMTNLIVFLTPRIIQNSEDIDRSIKDAMRQYRTQMEKDWQDMFPHDVLPQPNADAGEDLEEKATEDA